MAQGLFYALMAYERRSTLPRYHFEFRARCDLLMEASDH
jgi:hypothetical protein